MWVDEARDYRHCRLTIDHQESFIVFLFDAIIMPPPEQETCCCWCWFPSSWPCRGNTGKPIVLLSSAPCTKPQCVQAVSRMRPESVPLDPWPSPTADAFQSTRILWGILAHGRGNHADSPCFPGARRTQAWTLSRLVGCQLPRLRERITDLPFHLSARSGYAASAATRSEWRYY